MKALVVGGTGPTGPLIVEGLVERGYDVTILHRGFHEVEFKYPIEHIHAEPHFKDDFVQALGGRSFDLVVAMYGRLRFVAEACAGHTSRFIAVGAGAPHDQRNTIYDVDQSGGLLSEGADSNTIGRRIAEARELVLDFHRQGAYVATYFGYPNIYGPRQLAPLEWSIIRRIREGRRTFILLDEGLHIRNRPYVENCAHAVLLGVDTPDASAGQFYACTDEAMPTDRYRLELVAKAMGAEIETVSFPLALGLPAWWWGQGDFRFAIEGRPPHIAHSTVSVEKRQRDLGYHDVVPVEEAYRRTVEWLLANQPEPGGEVEQQLGDPFDYAAEDAYLAAYREFARTLDAIPFSGYTNVHQYQHPTAPFQQGATAAITDPKTARGREPVEGSQVAGG